jgi:hypothetical protein
VGGDAAAGVEDLAVGAADRRWGGRVGDTGRALEVGAAWAAHAIGWRRRCGGCCGEGVCRLVLVAVGAVWSGERFAGAEVVDDELVDGGRGG